MTRCRDIERWVTAYVDGELDDGRASAVRGHVRRCPACLAVVEAETAVCEAAEALAPALDPPHTLWAGIEAQLAQAELADSHRPRLWLWWQHARANLWIGAAAVAAAVVAIGWTTRDHRRDRAVVQRSAAATSHAQLHDNAEPTRRSAIENVSVFDAFARDLARADLRYRDVIAELRDMANEQRSRWSHSFAKAFDLRLAELDQQVARARARAWMRAEKPPATHDALFAAYRSNIAFLSESAIDADWMRAGRRR